MTTPSGVSEELPRRLFLIGATIAVLLLLVLALDYSVAKRGADPELQQQPPPQLGPDQPIASEANVFRTQPGDLALRSDLVRHRPAHPRTIANYRALRAFPGAPPRIPHGLTAEEFRATGCITCHERGGYSARFDAYTPVTPHPELADCLQCHAANDAVVGVALPGGDPDARCRQCHTPGNVRTPYRALDWQALAWPKLNQSDLAGSPPVIPHELQLRGNCLSCHMGVAAVAEIRTDHPERASCRQCHVPATESLAFPRTSAMSTARVGGTE
jgi:cytochrome c-type protein NapB